MPLPLIPIVLGVISVIAAGTGVKKGIDAKIDIDKAQDINEEAETIAEAAKQMIENARDNTSKSISNLGFEKIRLLTTSVHDFVEYYGKIKNIELESGRGIDELRYFHPNSENFLKLKEVSLEAKQVAVNGLTAIGSGALLAFGTYSVVMSGLGGLVVTATTGTAISTLTGVAAKSATLAWLGGGALSAGGLGMAGGMAVLGGLVVGPALAIGGFIFASQAKKALNDSYSNLSKAKTFREQAINIELAMNAIQAKALAMQHLLTRLNSTFEVYVLELKRIVTFSGINWQAYAELEKQHIYQCVKIALAIKSVLDATMLEEDGQLNPQIQHVIDQGEEFLNAMK
jgi:hypothetical protein